MKHRGSEPVAFDLGDKMGSWLQKQDGKLPYDLIIPTPKHWSKILFQRHNSAELLADSIGRSLDVRVNRHALKRIRATSKQGLLLRSERADNVRGAFAIINPNQIKDRNILIVDDVITSGATAAAMTRAVRTAGAKNVDVICLARGLGES